jgi:preprotein translocase subunit SecG
MTSLTITNSILLNAEAQSDNKTQNVNLFKIDNVEKAMFWAELTSASAFVITVLILVWATKQQTEQIKLQRQERKEN